MQSFLGLGVASVETLESNCCRLITHEGPLAGNRLVAACLSSGLIGPSRAYFELAIPQLPSLDREQFAF